MREHPFTMPWRATCRAKVNLHLRIVRRRADGFHELETIFQSTSLADELVATPSPLPGIRLLVRGPEAAAILGEDPAKNLAVRAWTLAVETLRERGQLPDGWPAGVDLDLKKNIPVGAGLAGGSADAAGALRLVSAWAEGALSEADLAGIAARLGSDIPFCLRGGCALGTGRGEILEALPPCPADLPMLLVKPAFGISTAQAYGSCRPEGPGDLEALRRKMADLAHSGVETALDSLTPLLHNTFYRSSLPGFGQLIHLEQGLRVAGAQLVQLSGSGPTLIAFFPSQASAVEAYNPLVNQGVGCWLATPAMEGITVAPCPRG